MPWNHELHLHGRFVATVQDGCCYDVCEPDASVVAQVSVISHDEMGLSASLTFSPVGENVIDSSRVEPLLAYDDKCDLLHWHGSSAFRRSPRGPILLHPVRYFSLLSGCHRSALTFSGRRGLLAPPRRSENTRLRIQTNQLRLPRSGILHVPPPSCCSTRPMFAQCPRFFDRPQRASGTLRLSSAVRGKTRR